MLEYIKKRVAGYKDGGFWFKIGTIALVVLCSGFLVFRTFFWKKNVDGKLSTDRQKDLEYKLKHSINKKEKARLTKELEQLKQDVKEEDKKLANIETQAQSDAEIIADLDSWEDVDAHVK